MAAGRAQPGRQHRPVAAHHGHQGPRGPAGLPGSAEVALMPPLRLAHSGAAAQSSRPQLSPHDGAQLHQAALGKTFAINRAAQPQHPQPGGKAA